MFTNVEGGMVMVFLVALICLYLFDTHLVTIFQIVLVVVAFRLAVYWMLPQSRGCLVVQSSHTAAQQPSHTNKTRMDHDLAQSQYTPYNQSVHV